MSRHRALKPDTDRVALQSYVAEQMQLQGEYFAERLERELGEQGERLTESFNKTLEQVQNDHAEFRKRLAQTLRDRDAALRTFAIDYVEENRLHCRIRRTIIGWLDELRFAFVVRPFDEVAAIGVELGDEGSSAAATADGVCPGDPAGTSADGDERARPMTLPTPAGVAAAASTPSESGT